MSGSAAYDVILAALTTRLPCPHCGRTETCRCLVEEQARPQDRARLIEAALIDHGHLPTPKPPEPPDETAIRYAKWLASESRHPRYVSGGWKRILESEADVTVAATSALKYATRTGEDDIQSVVGFLTKWIEQRTEAAAGG